MLKAWVKTVRNMLVNNGIGSEFVYTVSDSSGRVSMVSGGIVTEIHQSILSFPIYYSTVKNVSLHFKNNSFTYFPQSLLLPTERIFK